MDEQQHNDQLLASAVTFLIDGRDEKAAMILLSCTLHYDEIHHSNSLGDYTEETITLEAPRLVYDVLELLIGNQYQYQEHPDIPAERVEKMVLCASVRRAFEALIGANVNLVVKAGIVQVTANWRKELLAMLRGETVTNQGLPFSPQTPIVTWNNLRFRSQTEIRVAEALERAQVLFLPNCMARLGFSQRQNREADFLVCQKGKWGILEVDSPSSHPPTRTVEDHERDRLFKAHGIRVVEHFDASECWENADGVVKRFLYLLGQ